MLQKSTTVVTTQTVSNVKSQFRLEYRPADGAQGVLRLSVDTDEGGSFAQDVPIEQAPLAKGDLDTLRTIAENMLSLTLKLQGFADVPDKVQGQVLGQAQAAQKVTAKA